MRNLNLLLCTLALFISANLLSQSGNFKTSYFTKELVNSILNQEGCTGIRMYPVVNPTTSQNEVMIVGIDNSGKEIYRPSSQTGKYRMCTGSTNNIAIDKDFAYQVADTYARVNENFVADLKESAVQSLMSGNSQGIAIDYLAVGFGNFGIRAYDSSSGLKAYGEQQPGNPCPSACGEPSQYLRPPQN